MKKIIIFALIASLTLSLAACGRKPENTNKEPDVVRPVETQLPDKPEPEQTDEIAGEISTPATSYVVVTGAKVNVRDFPSTEEGKIIGELVQGDVVELLGDNGEWSKIMFWEEVAYVSSQFLAPSDATESNLEESPPQEEAPTIDTATYASGSSIGLDPSWKYADYSKINSGSATLYKTTAANAKGKTICVNAGHGTSGGESQKTQCHPDGSPKVVSGSTAAGSTTATAIAGGTTFSDGTPERTVTLALAMVLKDELLNRGYDVLMIRESDDVQLDNIARTVIANNAADCHIAIHWDSSESDKGAFYISCPDGSFRQMEPVASHWQEHEALGKALISGLSGAGVKIFSGGSMAIDLTQTSYSTVPSVDIEMGDRVSDHSAGTLNTQAKGLADGIDSFFGF